MRGKYIYVDYGSGRFFTLSEISEGNWQRTEVTNSSPADVIGKLEGITSFGRDAQGGLYVTVFGNFQIANTGMTLPPHAASRRP